MKLSIVSGKAQRFANNLEDFQYMLEGIIRGQSDSWKESEEAEVWRKLVAYVEQSVISIGEVAHLASIHHQP